MKRQAGQMKQTRRRYSAEYRQEAVVLVDKIGVAAAAKQLGLHESQLYLWRSKTREQSDKSELAQQQMLEIAKLKRQLAERDEELAIIKRQPRTSQKTRSEVRIHPATCSDVQYRGNVSCAGCNPFRLLPMVVATRQSVAYSGAS